MHFTSIVLSAISCNFLIQGCLALPSKQSESVSCSKKDASLALLKTSIEQPLQFCEFWARSTYKTTSPFPSLSVTTLTDVCLCVIIDPAIVGAIAAKAPHPTSKVKYLSQLEDDITSPLPFCKFWVQG